MIRAYTNDGQLWEGIALGGWRNVATGEHITDSEFELRAPREIDPNAEASLPEYGERAD